MLNDEELEQLKADLKAEIESKPEVRDEFKMRGTMNSLGGLNRQEVMLVKIYNDMKLDEDEEQWLRNFSL